MKENLQGFVQRELLVCFEPLTREDRAARVSKRESTPNKDGASHREWVECDLHQQFETFQTNLMTNLKNNFDCVKAVKPQTNPHVTLNWNAPARRDNNQNDHLSRLSLHFSHLAVYAPHDHRDPTSETDMAFVCNLPEPPEPQYPSCYPHSDPYFHPHLPPYSQFPPFYYFVPYPPPDPNPPFLPFPPSPHSPFHPF